MLATVRWYIVPLLHCRDCTQFERWIYFSVIETTSVLIPLISLIFPIFWFVSNAVGNALLLSRFVIAVKLYSLELYVHSEETFLEA